MQPTLYSFSVSAELQAYKISSKYKTPAENKCSTGGDKWNHRILLFIKAWYR